MTGVTVVAATRESESDFVANTALGKTLAAYAPYGIGARLFYSNTRGLPEGYNLAIEETIDDDEIPIFLHDDVCLPDFFWLRRVAAGLKLFSLIGVAGNTRRAPKQPAWSFTRIRPTEHTFEWDEQACLLLDGVLLAARKSTFTQHRIRFDERFNFHFYDMDICRQFERAGLTMGRASISIIHDSGNENFGTPEWTAGYASYLQKWGE